VGNMLLIDGFCVGNIFLLVGFCVGNMLLLDGFCVGNIFLLVGFCVGNMLLLDGFCVGNIFLRVGAPEGTAEDVGCIEGTTLGPVGALPKKAKSAIFLFESFDAASDNMMRREEKKLKSYLGWC
jgi:hypothetical protein